MPKSKLFLLTLLSFCCSILYANIVSHDYYIDYNHQKIHLKEKSISKKANKGVIMLLNPLSIPAIKAFDIPGYSLMDSLAKNGYDVWAIDFIGEGLSSYPNSMQQNPAPKGIYPLQAQEAIKQLAKANDFILAKTKQKNLALLGWSWGSIVAAMYSIDHPKQINHLILYGAMYATHLNPMMQSMVVKPFAGANDSFNKKLPAYQNITWKTIEHHWKTMLDGNKSIVSQKTIDQVGQSYIDIDPKPFVKNSLRRPMGPMKDLFSIWNGKPIYDISKITTPTLVIHGDQDMFADKDLYSKLVNAKYKKQVILKQATHWLIYEKTRKEFLDQVLDFLGKNKNAKN